MCSNKRPLIFGYALFDKNKMVLCLSDNTSRYACLKRYVNNWHGLTHFIIFRPRSDSFVESPFSANYSASPTADLSMERGTIPHIPQPCQVNPHHALSRQRSAPVASKWNTQPLEPRLSSPQHPSEQVQSERLRQSHSVVNKVK